MRRTAPTVRRQPWQAGFRTYFRLAGDDWTPPAVLKSTLSAARDRMVVEATFRRPDGMAMKLKTRAAKDAAGDWHITEERMDVRLAWRPEGGQA